MKQFFIYNGSFYSTLEKVISHENRAFTYGDGLFETIHCLGTEPQFIDAHWSRLAEGMRILKMQYDNELSADIIRNAILRLLNKNRIFKGARIRLQVFRNEGGRYSPQNNNVSWILESVPLDTEKYELNKRGLVLDIFDEVHKPVNKLANLKTCNALIYVLAGTYRIENNLDDCVVLNQFGRIAETNFSNIFIQLGDKIITPPLSEGCIAGTMRKQVIQLCKQVGYTIEERGILEKNLIDAEEVFTTNAIQGIQWIGAYKEKRYFNFVSRKLIGALNEVAFTT